MVKIIINSKEYKIGEQLPDKITHAEVSWLRGNGIKISIPKYQESIIKSWLWDMVDRCECDYVTVNGVLTRVEDIKSNR